MNINRAEAEAAIRGAAANLGETLSDFRWDGDDPRFTLAANNRTREEVGEAGKRILASAYGPLVQKALAQELSKQFSGR